MLALLVVALCVASAVVAEEEEVIVPRVNPLENPDLFGGDMLGVNIDDRNAIPSDNQRWPNGVIPFYIDPGLSGLRSKIIAAMNHYHQTTCVRFKERTYERDFVHLFRGQGCYSNVGRIGGQQMLSLGQGCDNHGIIVHELGHAVGFFHEQNRSDRDNFINIFYNNIQRGMESQFAKLSPYQNRLLDRFDYNSIMLYGDLSFSKDGYSKTMLKKDGGRLAEVYEKYGLSQSDILRIRKLYRC